MKEIFVTVDSRICATFRMKLERFIIFDIFSEIELQSSLMLLLYLVAQ